ncbi:hypothetical protein CRYUN_Cryun09bG0023100 [Craigia yunnanensis]
MICRCDRMRKCPCQKEVLIESTGVIGQRIKKVHIPFTFFLPSTDSAAVAITTTDLVSKSVAIEYEVEGTSLRVGGMAKGSGMIHHNMATMLGVITTDALVESECMEKDGSGYHKLQFQPNHYTRLHYFKPVLMQSAKSIAWDGEGATCLIEAAVYGRDPNWGPIAAAAGYAGISFGPNNLQILLEDIMLMDGGQPLRFHRVAASNYLIKAGETHGTVEIKIAIGDGPGYGKAWGCDLSCDYVKINAEYTT